MGSGDDATQENAKLSLQLYSQRKKDLTACSKGLFTAFQATAAIRGDSLLGRFTFSDVIIFVSIIAAGAT